MLTRLAVATALLAAATAGCTGSDTSPLTAPTASASTDSRSASPVQPSTTTAQRITLTTTEVAGVPLGTAADPAENRLRQVLGAPVKEDLPGCNGESGRQLTWKELTAFLSDGGDGGPVELSGWRVDAGPNAASIALPYETAVGDSAGDILATVPSSTGEMLEEGPHAGNFVVTTEEAVGLLWLSPKRDGVVVEATFRAESCD